MERLIDLSGWLAAVQCGHWHFQNWRRNDCEKEAYSWQPPPEKKESTVHNVLFFDALLPIHDLYWAINLLYVLLEGWRKIILYSRPDLFSPNVLCWVAAVIKKRKFEKSCIWHFQTAKIDTDLYSISIVLNITKVKAYQYIKSSPRLPLSQSPWQCGWAWWWSW